MAFSDANRDLYLDPTEYVTFVNYLSMDYYGNIPFEQLPEELTTNFEIWAGSDMLMEIEGTYPGATPTPLQAEWIEHICFDTQTLIHEITTPAPTTFGTPSPTTVPTSMPTVLRPVDVPFDTCRTNMAVSDLSQNNLLENSEYVRFVNFMSESQFQYIEFEQLPDLLRFNFVILAQVIDRITGDRSIDIAGSAPGTTIADVTPDQLANLQKICEQTQNAINSLNLFGLTSPTVNPTTGTAPTIPEPPPTPVTRPPQPQLQRLPTRTPRPQPTSLSRPITPAPSIDDVSTAWPTSTYAECRLSIIFSDNNRDNLIGADEYVQLVYRLSNNEMYRFETFNNLPINIKDNYYALAAQGSTVGEINIYGVYPTQDATQEERAFLLQVCRDTEMAIAQAPTPAPVVAVTMAPTRDLSKCRQDMVKSDTSPRDNFLTNMEYTRFVTRLSYGAYLFSTFETLPQPLQDNFYQLASVERPNPEQNGYGTAIYIYGAIGYQNPDAIQVEFLKRICQDTELALEAATQPTVPTTPQPLMTPVPTVTPETPNPTTPNPTVTPLLPTTPWPTPQPTLSLSTPSPSIPRTSEPTSADGGSNAGALAGGIIGGVVGLLALCLCAYFAYTSLQGGNKKETLDGKTGDDGSERGGDDNYGGYGQPSTPTRSEGQGNIGIPISPMPPSGDLLGASSSSDSSEDDEKDEESDEEMGLNDPSEAPTKEYGEFGGPDLPMDFGMDLEEATASSGHSDDDESEEEDEEQGFGGGDGFDGGWGQGNDGGFGGGGWGASQDEEDDEDEEDSASQYSEDLEEDDEDRSGSYDEDEDRSGSGSYDEDEDRSYDEDESQMEEESQMDESQVDSEGSGEDEEEASQYSDEENEEDEASESEGSSVGEDENEEDEQENRNVGTAGAFGDGFGGDGFGAFGGDDFGGGGANDFFGGGDAGGGGDDGFGAGGGFGFGAQAQDASPESASGDIAKVSDRLDAQIDSGDWEGVAQSIASFEHDIDEEESDSDDDSDDNDTTTEDEEMRASYRAEVEELVNRVIPDERGNIDDMMEQFKGREQELVNTLKTMEEKSGVPRDVAPPAAATTAGPDDSPPSPGARGTLEAVDEEEESLSPSRLQEEEDESQYSGSYSGEEDEDRSQYSGDEGSQRDEEDEESSHFSREIEESMSVFSEAEQSQYSEAEQSQYTEAEGESQYSGSGSGSRSGEYDEEQSQSQYSEDMEQSQYDDEQSQYDDEQSQSQSQYSEDMEQSQYSQEEGDEESQYTEAEGQSQYSGSYSGEEEGSQYSEGEEGQSQYSGSQSQYDDDDNNSGEGESQYSGSQYDDQDEQYSGSYSGSGSFDD
ncbi:expressed unknown protein [Seminavis robusta]|uniref:EF-hand domain-containing protein n=1 Tax=Seminavis robusta TaxID=568900 RepID=A0A9N8GZP4_9STRA|nr:expressed unknown protein [Seminavis robusta]|eukprot:Sro6_g005540.1 n/a (1331) ;mRNA; r:231381-235373